MGPGPSPYEGPSLTWKARSTFRWSPDLPIPRRQGWKKGRRQLPASRTEYTTKHLVREKLKPYINVLAKMYQIRDSFLCSIIIWPIKLTSTETYHGLLKENKRAANNHQTDMSRLGFEVSELKKRNVHACDAASWKRQGRAIEIEECF